jgi:ABC-2 type transport system ATP-binding protein
MSVVVKDLVKYYGDNKALNGLCFEAEKGSITGFLGPNGAGKTTTMKIISGYLIADQGAVTINGLNLFEEPIQGRRKIGYLPENNPLYPALYVPEYLRSMGKPYKVTQLEKRVKFLIERVGLAEHQHKKIGALSKGLKQRVGLARTLLHDPEILILDEPTTGLDPNQLVEIRNLIVELGQEKTIILSTHIMQEIQAICQKAVVISQGKLVANLNVNELHTQNSLTHIEFEFANPIHLKILKNLPEIDDIQEISKTVVKVGATDERKAKIAVFNAAFQLNNPLLKIQTIQTNMEKVFQELTQK